MTHLIEQWQRPGHVQAIQTTQSLNSEHSFSVHPQHAKPTKIKEMIKAYNLPHEPKFLQQVHGTEVIEYHTTPHTQMEHQADACFTRIPHVLCAVMTADCLPVLLTDSEGTFIAAVHCGWRSLFANILQKTLAVIEPKHNIMAWLGPCIQQQQYEVDENFVIKYLKKHPNASSAFTAITAGKSHADLYTLATLQLQQTGVTDIQYDGHCTSLNLEYHSWRQNQTPLRMATMVWLEPKTRTQ